MNSRRTRNSYKMRMFIRSGTEGTPYQKRTAKRLAARYRRLLGKQEIRSQTSETEQKL